MERARKLMEGDMGCKSMAVLNCVRYNLPFGPRKGDDVRRHQLRACMDELYKKNPKTVPLYSVHTGKILESLNNLNVHLPGIQDIDIEAFNYLGQNCALRPSGRRVHMSRFCAAPYALVKHNLTWGIEEYELSHYCLEFDFLSSRKLLKVIHDTEKKEKMMTSDAPM